MTLRHGAFSTAIRTPQRSLAVLSLFRTGTAQAQTALASVSALTISQGAVVSWILPNDMSDACEVAGFVVTAMNEAEGLSFDATIRDPEARSQTMRGLTSGGYTFAVRIEYADGAFDDLVTMEANNVPDACISLTVEVFSEATRGMCSTREYSNPRSYEIENFTAGARYEVQVRAKHANDWAMNRAGEEEWSHARAARPND
ncbi:MAG: hypothetical protein OXH38_01225 [Chloroflexi bacterium]|nr:hypothetical protein [Chloroflexota bacterium]